MHYCCDIMLRIAILLLLLLSLSSSSIVLPLMCVMCAWKHVRTCIFLLNYGSAYTFMHTYTYIFGFVNTYRVHMAPQCFIAFRWIYKMVFLFVRTFHFRYLFSTWLSYCQFYDCHNRDLHIFLALFSDGFDNVFINIISKWRSAAIIIIVFIWNYASTAFFFFLLPL